MGGLEVVFETRGSSRTGERRVSGDREQGLEAVEGKRKAFFLLVTQNDLSLNQRHS